MKRKKIKIIKSDLPSDKTKRIKKRIEIRQVAHRQLNTIGEVELWDYFFDIAPTNFYDWDFSPAHVSQSMGISENTVRKAFDSLVEKKFLIDDGVDKYRFFDKQCIEKAIQDLDMLKFYIQQSKELMVSIINELKFKVQNLGIKTRQLEENSDGRNELTATIRDINAEIEEIEKDKTSNFEEKSSKLEILNSKIELNTSRFEHYKGNKGIFNNGNNGGDSPTLKDFEKDDIELTTSKEAEDVEEPERESPDGDSMLAQKWSNIVPEEKRTSLQNQYVYLVNRIIIRYKKNSKYEVLEKVHEIMLSGCCLHYILWAVKTVKEQYEEDKVKDKWIKLDLLPKVVEFPNYQEEYMNSGKNKYIKEYEPIDLFNFLTTVDEEQLKKEKKESEEREQQIEEKRKSACRKDEDIVVIPKKKSSWDDIGKF